MKYSEKSLAKVLRKLSIAIDNAKQKEELHVHVSKGNKKIGLVHNFSIAPVFTCSNCKECKSYCYDLKACAMYPQVSIARAENTVLMREHREKAFSEIDNYISHKKAHKYFRWHVAGDIMDIDYFDHMIKIAKKYPDWTFWTYTKNYDVVNKYCDMFGKESIPQNLSVMFSVWNGLEMDNQYGFPTFTCVQEGMETPKSWHCPGNCDICKKANRGCIASESAYCYEH